MSVMPEKITARVTHLEMTSPPTRRVHAPMGQKIALMRAEKMPVAFYRYLYEQVGKAHHWQGRRFTSDEDLQAILHSDACQIDVLYVDGAPSGFAELALQKKPEEAEILYFGISPDFQGRGLARYFLSEAIGAAWAHNPQRVILQTNTVDSPRALRLYQQAGFSPYAWSEEIITPWA